LLKAHRIQSPEAFNVERHATNAEENMCIALSVVVGQLTQNCPWIPFAAISSATRKQKALVHNSSGQLLRMSPGEKYDKAPINVNGFVLMTSLSPCLIYPNQWGSAAKPASQKTRSI